MASPSDTTKDFAGAAVQRSGGPADGTTFDAAAELTDQIPVEGCALDLVGILSAVQETAYLWDLATDRIEWESNVAEVLDVDPQIIGTGTDFHFLIAAEHIQRRQEAVTGPRPADPMAKNGAHYRVQYRFTPGGRRSETSLWLEDHGRCWFDETGRPVKARGIVRVINERYLEEQRLLYRSDHDELTGQLNRIRLTEALGAVVTRSERTKQSCAFLMASVNNLAVINETFGFDVGDEVIAATARIIRARLRGGDTIGRYSSNKFGIILNECGPAAMRVAAERFMKAIRDAAIKTTACQVSATISVGGVLLPDHARTTHQGLSHALQALDKARSKRHETFIAFEPNAARETTRQRNITIADEVISALDQNRMLIALQPMMTCGAREPGLYECLLRMERPDGVIISAGEFITVAEQLGLSRLIDRRTLELSIEILKKHPNIKLSVNVSGLTASDHEWLVTLHRLTGGRRQLTERLTIEITETAAIHDLDLSINFVDTLKELGCKVAIDDFGAGYTSFRNLKFLGVDMVKIDGSFVKNLMDDKGDRVFVKTFIDLANAFGMETVAEWVGDERTALYLIEAGVTYMQGYHYGKPQLAGELLRVQI